MKQMAAVIGAALVSGAIVTGQSAPRAMSEEPHHQRIFYTAHMRVFDVTIPPGDLTLDHRLDRDVATIALGDSTTRTQVLGGDWGAPLVRATGSAAITTYTGAPVVHRVENVGQTPHHLLAAENLREGGWTTPTPIAAPGTTLLQESRAFAVYDVRLNAATPNSRHAHVNPTLVILLSGAIEVQGGGGESAFRMVQPGRWFPSSGPEHPHGLTLVGTGEAHIMCLEAR